MKVCYDCGGVNARKFNHKVKKAKVLGTTASTLDGVIYWSNYNMKCNGCPI